MGAPAVIVTKTPLRLSLFGGGTDYPAYAGGHGGVCVGLALDRYVYVSVKRRDGFGEGRYRVATSRLDVTDDPSRISNPCVRGCLSVADPGCGVEVIHTSDVPGRCGVGSSSAFAVGLLNALSAARGEYHGPHSLWARACHVERDVLGETVGMQDQAWAAFGGAGRLDFPAGGGVRFTPLPLGPAALADLCRHLAVVYLGTQRTASEAATRYTAAGDFVARTHATKAVAEEGWDAACRADWGRLGKLLDRAWLEKRKLAGVTSSAIDRTVCKAIITGAWGAKLMGAGGGAGCLAVVVPPDRRDACLRAILDDNPGAAEIRVGVGVGSRVVFGEWE